MLDGDAVDGEDHVARLQTGRRGRPVRRHVLAPARRAAALEAERVGDLGVTGSKLAPI